jgi:AraC-like DNA-binding protein
MREAGANETPEEPHADAFELHAAILRHQIEAMLTRRPNAERHDEAVALASLWSRVAERPRGPWDAEGLASALGVSRTSLYRMVKRHHATSPARVVEGLRMDQARRLLAESRYSIEVIADQVGYASAFSFSAAFRRCVGKPPSQFRLDAIREVGRG